jgi:lipoprotein-releasing system ATP-binding protein
VLDVKHVSKSYPTPRGPLAVLADVSLTLAPGDAAAIMGPSGTGKSTLLYIVGALEPPTSGSVTLDGTDPFTLAGADLAAFRNEQVGFVFQDHCLLPQCSVLENVLIPTLVARDSRTGDAIAWARHLVDQVGLADRADHRPAALSGGERPGNLDRASADVVASLLLELPKRQNVTLMVVTHSVQLAERCPIRFELSDHRLKRLPVPDDQMTR